MNNLYLIVINDGNGYQCGYTYKRRLDVARGRNRHVHLTPTTQQHIKEL